MKKKGSKKIEGNVILFPDLEKRLLNKGLEQLQDKKFTSAIKLLNEAKILSPEDGDVYIALVLAYYESGELQQARDIAVEMLKEGIGDYFQAIDLYLMILVQLHEYKEIIHTIEVLLDEREIPFEKQEHFSKLLTLSKRMIEQDSSFEEGSVPLNEEWEVEHLFESEDPSKQMLVIAELTHKNIRPYIDKIEVFLKDEKAHPFLKTMLLNAMIEQEVEKEVTIKKFGWEKRVSPAQLTPPQENKQLNTIQSNLQNINNDDPVLFQHIISLLERHLFLIYPFEFPDFDQHVWPAAYHVIGLDFHGMEYSIEEFEEQYGVEKHRIERACAFIQELEKISFPII